MFECDVIVPIYNAYDAVKECIESVLKNTDFKKAHLILIDDKSPDERIIPLLEGYAKKNKNKITLLLNEKNLGFVGTVNRGMKYSKNDVLLLNSDTEVPKGWLDRIMECAYSDSTIATVTPLSNNATLASVPKMFYRNEIPNGMTLEEMSKVVRECSLKEYPEIPTAHGFCMYIKREALDKVGFFDEEAFGKGYGEENDFSFRCFKYGYRHVLCDDTYVLHKESQSFLDEKVDNSKALAKKHPELKNALDNWCRIRDIQRIGNNIALKIGLMEDRPNILFVIHDFSNISENKGGTTLHILDLIRNLRNKYNFHVLSQEYGMYKVHSFFKDTDVVTNVYSKPATIETVGLYNGTYKQMVEKILKDYKISFVHIHHMIGHFFDIARVAKENKVSYAVSLHDFYLETPVASKLDEKVAGKTESPIDIKAWREACQKMLEGADYVFAPSEFTKHEYSKVYKNVKIKVISHGVEAEKVEATIRKEEEIKNIAFVGAIFPHKGSEILSDLTEKITKTDKIKIHLFGMTTADIKNKKYYVNHGEYDRKDLARLLNKNKIDLVCIFPLAPETYAYTVDEVVMAGMPIFTFDIGAGAERVKDNNLGWVIKYTNNAGDILRQIKKVLASRNNYKEKIEAINKYEMRTTKEMAQDYDAIYKKHAKVYKLDYIEMQRGTFEASFVVELLATNYNKSYEEDYFAVIGSAKWRLVSKIKVPTGVRKVAKKAYNLAKGQNGKRSS